MNDTVGKNSRFYLVHIAFLTAAVAFRAYLSLNLGIIGYPDTETYELFALQVLSGDPVTLPVRPLGYPIFLTWVYKIIGPDRTYVIYFQHLLGAFSYLLYYPVFLHLSGRRAFSAALALIATFESVLVVYERALLSDFLNHFFILLSICLFFKYLSSRKTWLAFPLGASAFIAGTIRPTSVIVTALIAVFLSFKLIGALMRDEGAGRYLRALAAFALTFLLLNALFYVYSIRRAGFKGEPVGVFGLTMLVRTADFIDYGGGGPQAAADHIGGYALMTEIQCPMSPETVRTYRDAALSAAKFYGEHEVGRHYFTVYDVLREMKCDVKTVDRIFMDIAKEAAVSNSFSYALSVFKSAFAFIRSKPMEYQAIYNGGGGGAIPALVRLYFPLDNFLALAPVSALLSALFLIGALSYFMDPDRPPGGLTEAAFLTTFVAVNYLSISLMLDASDAIVRYKISSSPLQLALFSFFAYNLLRRFARYRKTQGR